MKRVNTMACHSRFVGDVSGALGIELTHYVRVSVACLAQSTPSHWTENETWLSRGFLFAMLVDAAIVANNANIVLDDISS